MLGMAYFRIVENKGWCKSSYVEEEEEENVDDDRGYN